MPKKASSSHPSEIYLALQPHLFDKSIEQHQAFTPGLEKLYQYAITTKPDVYSGSEVRAIVNSFAPAMQQHLADEIDELLALQILDSEALMKVHEASEKAKTPEKGEEMFPL